VRACCGAITGGGTTRLVVDNRRIIQPSEEPAIARFWIPDPHASLGRSPPGWGEYVDNRAGLVCIVGAGPTGLVEQGVDRSRRNALRAAAKGVSAGLLLRISPTQASEKMTLPQAEYQDTPNGIYSCGMCTLFEPPNTCKVVTGEISKDGWCKAFALAD
jgi:hypothetical protein